MPWIKDVCVDAVCGTCLGICQGVFGISVFTAEELEEVNSLKNLALSVMEKAPPIVSDATVCKAIRSGKKSGLETFKKTASPQAVATGVVTAAELICNKSFKQRFGDVLTGACLNLVGC